MIKYFFFEEKEKPKKVVLGLSCFSNKLKRVASANAPTLT